MSQPEKISRGLTTQQKRHRARKEKEFRAILQNDPITDTPYDAKEDTYKPPTASTSQIPSLVTSGTSRTSIHIPIDAYEGNYPEARRRAIARSRGICQFCGLREAEEGHHWAWPFYPSGDAVLPSHLTALCKSCHTLATLVRNWVTRDGADFDMLALDLENADSFFEQREVFSFWLFPEEDEEISSANLEIATANRKAHNAKMARSRKQRRPSGCVAWLMFLPFALILWWLFFRDLAPMF